MLINWKNIKYIKRNCTEFNLSNTYTYVFELIMANESL